MEEGQPADISWTEKEAGLSCSIGDSHRMAFTRFRWRRGSQLTSVGSGLRGSLGYVVSAVQSHRTTLPSRDPDGPAADSPQW